jgi:hypothetical protein
MLPTERSEGTPYTLAGPAWGNCSTADRPRAMGLFGPHVAENKHGCSTKRARSDRLLADPDDLALPVCVSHADEAITLLRGHVERWRIAYQCEYRTSS